MMSTEGAIALVDQYLQHCEDREMDEAAALWAGGEIRIEFPGPVRYESLGELVDASRGQYAWVRKHRDEYVAAVREGEIVVTSIGRLYGENLHAVPFGDVRYVDVFVVRDGVIRGQRVWNDLAVSGVLARTA